MLRAFPASPHFHSGLLDLPEQCRGPSLFLQFRPILWPLDPDLSVYLPATDVGSQRTSYPTCPPLISHSVLPREWQTCPSYSKTKNLGKIRDYHPMTNLSSPPNHHPSLNADLVAKFSSSPSTVLQPHCPCPSPAAFIPKPGDLSQLVPMCRLPLFSTPEAFLFLATSSVLQMQRQSWHHLLSIFQQGPAAFRVKT